MTSAVIYTGHLTNTVCIVHHTVTVKGGEVLSVKHIAKIKQGYTVPAARILNIGLPVPAVSNCKPKLVHTITANLNPTPIPNRKTYSCNPDTNVSIIRENCSPICCVATCQYRM